jgi:membrane-associated protease RseP (regulator of RpoE activity)
MIIGAALTLNSIPMERAAAIQQRKSVRIIRKDTTGRDSTMTMMIDIGAVLQMTRDLLTSKAMEETIAHALREARGAQNDPVRARQLEAELGKITNRSAALSTAIQIRCDREPAPQGYLGVSFDNVSISRENNAPAVYEFDSRPTIVSVEPGSPAQKAGILNGDVLVSIGGQDVRKPVPLGALLKPGARVQVKFIRAGTTREVAVVVEKRPPSFGDGNCAEVNDLVGSDHAPVMTWYRPPYPPYPPSPASPASPPETPRAPQPPSGFMVSPVPMVGFNGVAGAQLTPVDDDWRDLVGVDRGLVVVGVTAGSPAQRSGLKKGDVITSVDDAGLSSVRMLQRAIGIAEGRSVKLQVVRKGKPLAITLSWQ